MWLVPVPLSHPIVPAVFQLEHVSGSRAEIETHRTRLFHPMAAVHLPLPTSPAWPSMAQPGSAMLANTLTTQGRPPQPVKTEQGSMRTSLTVPARPASTRHCPFFKQIIAPQTLDHNNQICQNLPRTRDPAIRFNSPLLPSGTPRRPPQRGTIFPSQGRQGPQLNLE